MGYLKQINTYFNFLCFNFLYGKYKWIEITHIKKALGVVNNFESPKV